MKAPHRHIEAELKISADTWEELAHRLRDLATLIDLGNWRGPGVSVGWGSSFIWEVSVDDKVDGDLYRAQNAEYVASLRDGRP